MTSPLARIESHPQEAKLLIGIDYEQFLALVALSKQRHLEKQTEIEKNQVRIIAPGGGRKPEMSPQQGVCLCLVYLRQKPIFEILGLLFDISKTLNRARLAAISDDLDQITPWKPDYYVIERKRSHFNHNR